MYEKSKHERYVLFGVIGILIITLGMFFYPSAKAFINGKTIGNKANVSKMELKKVQLKAPKDYYGMFKCSCCGRPIDTGCCGMAKQGKEYLDKLLLEGLEENEVMYRMVKKFGFNVLMDTSKEQEIRDYIKSKSPDNPPRITVNPQRFDFGTIRQSDGNVSTSFVIRNTGKSDLVIDSLDTSCMCTTARLIYKGQPGPVFGMGMHGNNPENYALIIPPGETAELGVYYNPMAHGKQKKPEVRVVREVMINSNDPVDFQKKVRIELTQVP